MMDNESPTEHTCSADLWGEVNAEISTNGVRRHFGSFQVNIKAVAPPIIPPDLRLRAVITTSSPPNETRVDLRTLSSLSPLGVMVGVVVVGVGVGGGGSR